MIPDDRRELIPLENSDFSFPDLSAQRENVLNEPFDFEQAQVLEEPPLPLIDGKQLDLEQLYERIDAGDLERTEPSPDDLVSKDLLEPAPLNFNNTVGSSHQDLKEYMGHITDSFDHGR